jgi:alpha-tubulin suppressor-like RCC1 family protein
MGHRKFMNRNAIVAIYLALALFNQGALGQPPTGRIIAWGDNPGGAIFGYPTTGDAMGYVRAGDQEFSDVVAIATQGLRAMALKKNRTVAVWGRDLLNKGLLLTIPDGLSNVTAVALATDHNVALKTDGTIVAWGYAPHPSHPAAVLPQNISNIVAIACAGWDTLAIKGDGRIEKWGPGPLGWPPSGLSNIVAIANGTTLGEDLALRWDGSVVEWPCFYANDTYTMPRGLSNVVAIASGGTFALALKKSGTVVAWGCMQFDFMNPNYGQLNVPVGLSNVVAIAAGRSISLALKKDGTVAVWGDNHHHQVDLAAGLTNIEAIAAGQDFCLAIQANSALTITNAFPELPKLSGKP